VIADEDLIAEGLPHGDTFIRVDWQPGPEWQPIIDWCERGTIE
jgi:hypothetical protein